MSGSRRPGRTRAFHQSRHGIAPLKREILAAVNKAQNDGRPGLNTHEIEETLKAAVPGRDVLHQSVSAAVNELVAEGVLGWTGIMRPTRTSRTLGEVLRIAMFPPTGARQPRLALGSDDG